MIRWSLETSSQWLECTEILDLGHLLFYCILLEGVTILKIKPDGLLNIPGNLDSILVLDIVPLSLGRKYLGHPNKIIGILGEAPCPFTIGHVREFIIS